MDCQMTVLNNREHRYSESIIKEPNRLLLIEDVTKKTGISVSTLRQYIRDGLVRPRKGWSTEAGRAPRKNRRCWLFGGQELETVQLIRENRRSALSHGLDEYWERRRQKAFRTSENTE